MSTLADLVRSAAGSTAHSVVADRRHGLPLVDAVHRAAEVARDVRRATAVPSPVVAVVLPTSVDAVVHLLAAILGDHTVCFLDPADTVRSGAALDAVDPDVVVDAGGLRTRPRAVPRTWAPGYVALSSGSTGGGPKGVVTTWESVADFAPHGVDALAVDATARWAEPNHPTYDLALTNWLLALSAGASLHVTSALGDRLRPLALTARTGATHVRLAPRYVDLAVADRERGTPCGVRVWGSGGDRLSVRCAEQVLGLGVPTLVNTYGTSETAGFASTASYAAVEELRVVEGVVSIGAGRTGPWRVGLEEQRVDGVAGDVLTVSSPHLGGGYAVGGHEHAFPRWEPGRVVTGDLGAQVGTDLFCFGRAGRLVKRSATFVNLDDVDTALRDHRGLTTYTVATRGGAVVTLVEGEQDLLTGLRRGLTSVIAPDLLPDELVAVHRLPRLGNGKADQASALEVAETAAGRRPAAVADR